MNPEEVYSTESTHYNRHLGTKEYQPYLWYAKFHFSLTLLPLVKRYISLLTLDIFSYSI